MIRALYNWTIRLAEHRHALWALAFVAFVESSVFPLPPDLLLIPMVIAVPRRAFLYATVAMVASVLGGILGYWVGAVLFDSIGGPILSFYGKAEYFDQFKDSYNAWGAWAVLIAGITPFPYKVVTILSGTTGLNFYVFVVASIIARGFRFFLVAALLWKFGTPIRDFIERRLGMVFSIAMALLLGGFVVARYI